ncbi:MAG: YkgJ family cysteine cluster protein [Proteobacteria bacterium]|nr:YkgJ family cysteine cluster protein [Pseudomonadota bacterium]MBU1709122.1 YkgJ family cysteine cluster protein [Pseudomonadota bacterium]
MENKVIINQCQRCGTCCHKGGPALHIQDKELLLAGNISYRDLVTLRKGERAYSPLTGKIEPIEQELVKISGKEGEWTCRFIGEDLLCGIYGNRPLECRLLKCWDPDELLGVINKDLISRLDIIHPDDPIIGLLQEHDQECGCVIIDGLAVRVLQSNGDQETLEELNKIVRKDLAIRARANEEYGITMEVEMFLFGRPVFIFLSSYGFSAYENEGEIYLKRM